MTFASHENWVRCVIFHPSGKYLISSSDDKTIRILDIKVEIIIQLFFFSIFLFLPFKEKKTKEFILIFLLYFEIFFLFWQF